jgi:hypothetical protein
MATDLRQRIAAFGDVYKIPQRWQGKIDTIGDGLFRQIRLFLSGRSMSRDDPISLLTTLDQFLENLYADQGKGPFVFAMIWWLAALINQEVEPAARNPAHAMPQVVDLLQALSIESGHGMNTQSSPGALTPPSALTFAKRLREEIRGS